MSVLETKSVRFYPTVEEDRQLVRSELDDLTKNGHFFGSKRYPALLRYVVEKALEGKSDELKERTIGIEVFNRPPDYDTNSDTIVRVTAGEVRKRLALTYLESGSAHLVQIVLPAGTYVPDFYRYSPNHDVPRGEWADPAIPEVSHGVATLPALVDKANDQAVVEIPAVQRLHEEPNTERSGRLITRKRFGGLTTLVLVGMLGLAAGFILAPYRTIILSTPLNRFWSPVGATGTPVLFCAGALIPTQVPGSGFTEANKYDDYPYVSVATATALAAVGNQLTSSHTPYFVQPSSSSSLTDMRQHPTILIGAYDNRWTILMSKELRYRFAEKPTLEIYDSKNPSRVWARVDALPYKDKDDYAILARFHDKVTDNDMIIIAGLGKNGTEAAAQFATTPKYLKMLDRDLGKGWGSRNIEIVLKATVVDSKTGAPSIEALEVW